MGVVVEVTDINEVVFCIRFTCIELWLMEINMKLNTLIELKCVMLTGDAMQPTRATESAAGCDLYSSVDISIPMRGRAVVPTEIAVELS